MYHCIVNPAAGRGNGQSLIPVIDAFMRDRGIDIDIKIPSHSSDAAKLAKEACTAGSQGIIGVGGDGTIQNIVTGMLDNKDRCDTPLGVISCGSGNDWIRSFGKKYSAIDCLNALLTGKIQAIDVIRVNNMVCINIANMGLDARIVRNAKPLKKVFGKSAYAISALISIFRHKNIPLTLHIDEKEKLEGKFTLAAACNGQYYGGGMRIAPSAVVNDGSITLCLVSAINTLKALILFPVMLLERHTHLKAVRYIECQKITLIPQGVQTLCLDGNLYECSGQLDFKILPKAIIFKIPA